MPNYGLVVTPEYSPMTYLEYAAPFEKYAEVYNQMADLYDTLEMEASKWEKLAKDANSQEEYKLYLNYANDLRNAANELVTKGLSTKTRGMVSDMKKRYAAEILPIESAWNYRDKMAEEQRKLNPKGDLQWDTDFSKIGLGPIMQNPTMGYKGRSLSEMELAGEDIAKAASTRRILSKKARDMGNLYYRIMRGYDGGDVLAFLNKNANDPAFLELMLLYNQIRTSYGTNNTQSIYTTALNNVADERILTGMLKGLAYNEDYLTNYLLGLTPSRRGSGGGGNSSEEINYNPIGYSIVYTDDNEEERELTRVNESGKVVYYEEDGTKKYLIGKTVNDDGSTELTLQDKDGVTTVIKQSAKLAKKSQERYATVSAGNKSDVYIVDLWDIDPVTERPKKVVDKYGRHITYDRNTHYWDAVTKEVKPIKSTTDTNSQLTPMDGVVFISNTEGLTDLDTDWDEYSLEKINALFESTADALHFEQLTSSERLKLPDNVMNHPGAFIYYRLTIDAKGGGTGDNNVLFYKYVGTKAVPKNLGAATDEDDIT